MKLRVRKTTGGSRIELRGALIIGQPVEALRRTVSEILTDGARGVVLDMSGVPYADACGLGALVESQRRAEAGGVALEIMGVGRKLRELFEITGLRMDRQDRSQRASLRERTRGHSRSVSVPSLGHFKALVA